MSELLRPCPFCSGQAHMESDYSSERGKTYFSIWHCCPKGGDRHLYGEGTGRMHIETAWFENPDRCIDAWNERWEL